MNGHVIFPKSLLEPPFSNLSPDSKWLYSFMLDRHSLSVANGVRWQCNGATFIYFSHKDIATIFGWGHDKATRLLRELESVHLIRRVHQGLGKPDRIFVNTAPLPSNISSAKPRENPKPAYGNSVSNNPDSNNLELIETDPPLPRNPRIVETILKDHINYDTLCLDVDDTFIDSLIFIMVESICNSGENIVIGGIQHSLVDISTRFLALTDVHIRRIYTVYMEHSSKIRHPKGYFLKLLYEAPLNTMFA